MTVLCKGNHWIWSLTHRKKTCIFYYKMTCFIVQHDKWNNLTETQMHWLVRFFLGKPNISVYWFTSELRVRLVQLKIGLSLPVKYFYWPFQGGASFVDHVISVLFCYYFMHVCLLMPCGNLLVKGWPLGSRLWCLIVTLSLFHWYPGSGVALDCIDSWSLPSFLLWAQIPIFVTFDFDPFKLNRL